MMSSPALNEPAFLRRGPIVEHGNCHSANNAWVGMTPIAHVSGLEGPVNPESHIDTTVILIKHDYY